MNKKDNGWLQHNVDSMDGRALWTELISAKNYDFYIKMTVRDGVYSGVIMRDEEIQILDILYLFKV